MNGVIATWMLSTVLGVAAPGDLWHEDYAAALAASRKDDKPLLVVLHNPEEPKQTIRQVGFTRDPGQLSLLKNYHLCRVDVSTETGKRVAAAFKAKSYPQTVITDKASKKVIFKKAGLFSDGEWTTTLADYRRGVRPISLRQRIAPSPDYCST